MIVYYYTKIQNKISINNSNKRVRVYKLYHFYRIEYPSFHCEILSKYDIIISEHIQKYLFYKL